MCPFLASVCFSFQQSSPGTLLHRKPSQAVTWTALPPRAEGQTCLGMALSCPSFWRGHILKSQVLQLRLVQSLSRNYTPELPAGIWQNLSSLWDCHLTWTFPLTCPAFSTIMVLWSKGSWPNMHRSQYYGTSFWESENGFVCEVNHHGEKQQGSSPS